MQLINLDFWGAFVALISFLFTTCTYSATTTTGNPGSSHLKLVSPKDEQPSLYDSVQTKLTLILLKEGQTFIYEGLNVNTGKLHGKNEIGNAIQKAKRKYPTKTFVVLIKPTVEAAYKDTVDILDEMVINKIDRYSIEKLSTEEQQKLIVTDKQD